LTLAVEYIPGQPGRPGFDWFFGGWLAEWRGLWVLVDCGVGGGAGDLAGRPGESPAERLDRLADGLWREDPEMAPLHNLPPVEIGRERFFLRNNLAGLLEGLEAAETEASGGGGG